MNEFLKQTSSRQVNFSKRFVADCFDAASRHSASLHRERRILCIGHLNRIKLMLFEAVGSLVDSVTLDLSLSDIAVILAMLSYGHYEMKWLYLHADISQTDLATAFAQSMHSSSGAVVNVEEESNEGTDLCVLTSLLFQVQDLLCEHIKPLSERIRTCLSDDLKLLRSAMATVLSSPDLPSASSKGLLRQLWSEIVAYAGMSEESASQAQSMLTAIKLNWLRFSFETSSAAGSAAIHDIECRVMVALNTSHTQSDVEVLPDNLGCIEFLSHIADNCMPMLRLDSCFVRDRDLIYLLGVSFDRHEKLERRLVSSKDKEISSHITLPLRLYSDMRRLLQEQQQRSGVFSHSDSLDKLQIRTESYITALENRVETLLTNLYKEGIASLDRQLLPAAAAQRCLATQSTANSRRMRRASYMAPHQHYSGAGAKPLPGYESFHVSGANLSRMQRDSSSLQAIIHSIDEFERPEPKLAIQGCIESFVRSTIHRNAIIDVIESGNIQANQEGYSQLMCRPSDLKSCFQDLASLLAIFNGSSFLQPMDLLRNAIDALGLIQKYASWYLHIVLSNVYSPSMDRFETSSEDHLKNNNKIVDAIDFTARHSLTSLFTIFGEMEMLHAINTTFEKEIERYINDIHSVLNENVFNNNNDMSIDNVDVESASDLLDGDRAFSAIIAIGKLNVAKKLFTGGRSSVSRDIKLLSKDITDLMDSTTQTIPRSGEFNKNLLVLESFINDNILNDHQSTRCDRTLFKAILKTILKSNIEKAEKWEKLPQLVIALLLRQTHVSDVNSSIVFSTAIAPLVSSSLVALLCYRESKLPSKLTVESSRVLLKRIDDTCLYIQKIYTSVYKS